MHLRSMALPAVCAALAALAGAGIAAGVPVWTDAEKEDFLRRAEVVRAQRLAIGVTASKRVTLALGGRTHDAHVQSVDAVARRHRERPGEPARRYFRDSYRYNVAAYRLDRLLELRLVPVSVARSFKGRMSAFTWWVDDVLMMEKERRAGGVEPPDPRSWREQGHRRRVFHQLIDNADPNLGNLLITRDWRVWSIDFTRAFRRRETLSDPASLVKIEGSLLERLRGLSREQIESRLRDCLRRDELRPLLTRRDAIVAHFDREIARRGAAAVLYEPVER